MSLFDSFDTQETKFTPPVQAEDKEKTLEWLSMASPMEASPTRQELSTAAKVVEISETDKETGHKIFPQNVLWVGGCRTRRMACQD